MYTGNNADPGQRKPSGARSTMISINTECVPYIIIYNVQWTKETDGFFERDILIRDRLTLSVWG